MFWETALDVASLIASFSEVAMNPSDVWAWVGLVGDIVDLFPFVTGVGEAVDVMRVANKVDDAIDAAKSIGKSIDSYRNLKKVTKGTGLEVHHIVEKRFARDLDIKNTNDMLSIALTPSEHRAYTNAWRKEIGYDTGPHTPQEIWNAAKKVYADRPDLLEAARITIFGR